jgi:pimeloyl-ACP methyl ester carboxylesterase
MNEPPRALPDDSRGEQAVTRQVTSSIVISTVAFWSEGSQLSAVLSRPGGGDVYPAIIWSHGYGGYSDAIGAAVVAGHLPDQGFALLRVDHRGCGRSQPSVRGPCVQGSESVQDLVNAVTYLGARGDIDRDHVVLMGESHGGAAALSAAAFDPRVCGVLAADAFSDGRAWLQEMWTGAGRQSEYAELLRRARLAEEALVLGEAPEVVPIEEVIPYAPDDLALFRSLCESHPLWSRRASLATVQAIGQLRPASLGGHLRDRPVRLIHGSEDGTVPVRHLDVLRSAVGTEDYHVVSGIGHGVTSACPEVVIPLMLEWLEQVVGKPRSAGGRNGS